MNEPRAAATSLCFFDTNKELKKKQLFWNIFGSGCLEENFPLEKILVLPQLHLWSKVFSLTNPWHDGEESRLSLITKSIRVIHWLAKKVFAVSNTAGKTVTGIMTQTINFIAKQNFPVSTMWQQTKKIKIKAPV